MPNQNKTFNDSENAKIERMWKCQNCGHVVIAIKPPEVCPMCTHAQCYLISNEVADWSGTLKKILIEANEKEMTLEEVTKLAVEQNLITESDAAELLKTAKSVDNFGKRVFKEEPEKRTSKTKIEKNNISQNIEKAQEEKKQVNNRKKTKEDQKTRDE